MSYENPTGTHLFAIDPPASGPAEGWYSLARTDLKEDWFRNSIATNPEIVVSACRRAGLTDERWYSWGTEVRVTDDEGNSVGKVDVLLVSETGRVGIVETKLSYNPEKRRSVVAQVLDYALNLREQDLDNIEADLPSEEGDTLVAAHTVRGRLADGDYLLVVVGDALDPRAVRLGQTMLADHVLQRWDLALVDMALYKRKPDVLGPEWLLVPTLRGTLLAESRQVFEIRVTGLPAGAKTVTTAIHPKPAGHPRAKWNEESFRRALTESVLPDEFKDLAQRLLELADRHPEVTTRFGTARGGSLILKRNGYGLLEFHISGSVRYRRRKILKGLPPTVSARYLDAMRKLVGTKPNENYPSAPTSSLDGKTDEVIELLEDVLSAAGSESG